MNKMNEERLRRILNLLAKIFIAGLVVYLLWMCPTSIQAQNYDYGSVEAYINDHKQQRSLLMARATLEYGNRLLHEQSANSAIDYKEVNVELDKYTRAFEIIDVIYQSARVAVNVSHAYDDVTETVQGYKEMLTLFNDKIIQRGKIETADTILLSISYRAIQDIGQEGEYLYKSFCDLGLYCTGVCACTTSDILLLLENINGSIERIRKMIKSAYFDTWKYVQLRTGFWKGKVYQSRTMREILDDSFSKWKRVGQEVIIRNID